MRFTRRHVTATLSTAAVITATLGVGFTTSGAAAPPQLMRGIVTDAKGVPVPGAQVAAYVLSSKTSNNTQVASLLATATTNARGQYTLAGGLTKAVTRNPDSSVSLEVNVIANRRTKMFNLTALPPSKTRPDWGFSRMADTSFVRPSAVPAARTTALLTGFDLNMKNAVPFDAAAANVAAARTVAPSNAAMAGGCQFGAPGYVWEPAGGTDQKRAVKVQELRTRDHGSMQYSWDNTSHTEFQIGYSTQNGDEYKGGFDFSRKDSTNQSAEMDPVHDYWAGWIRATWRYKKMKKMCVNDMGVATDTGTRKWQPWQWTSGVRPVRDSSAGTWKCPKGNRSTITAGHVHVSRGSSAQYGASFKFGDLSLASAQENAKSFVLTIGSKNTSRWCGSNDDPLYAKKVMEWFR